jgi:hypothetical protein
MNRKLLLASSLFSLALAIGSFSIAQDKPKDHAQSGGGGAGAQPEMKLPPGWTEEDMKAFADAATPGKMHEHLNKSVGTWEGKSTMWMSPDSSPMTSDCTSVCEPMMDGKFIKCSMKGPMPGMGMFEGFGIYGFDNVSKKFQCSWLDNMGTGMMNGTGDLSADGKTITWTFNYYCPIAKKQCTMREIETMTSATTKTLEMHGADPKSGKEYKMMVIEFTKK